nr:4-alpha-glucanotransferase [Haloferula luteola]
MPVFSARRDGDGGIGDTRALIEWLELCAKHEVRVLQLLPINEMGTDDSPYNAISSVALEPLYLTMEEVPGVDLKGGVPESAAAVDYSTVREWKQGALRSAWARWGQQAAALHEEFARFCAAEADWLEDYTFFRVLVEKQGSAQWETWPEGWQTVASAREVVEREPEWRAYFAWVQWLCFRQWREVRRRADACGVRLMGDIPIGVSRSSADVYMQREDFDLDWSGGAPPETVFKHDAFIRKWGQNWGIPLYRWGRMAAEGYPWWRRRIDKLTDVFHIFRIDHVLGFYRIYAFPWSPSRNGEFLDLSGSEAAERTGGALPRWVPRPDDYETNCDANRADGDRRLRVIQSAAGTAEVVAEDLGCVPDYVRPHLASLGIPGFRIPHWDRDQEGRVIPGEEFPECSFATYATHDHDSIPAMWEDFRRRASLENEDEDDRKEVRETWQALAEFAGLEAEGAFDDGVYGALVRALMAARSRYAAILITDFYRSAERINQPGTVGGQNWSYRVPETAEVSGRRKAWKEWQEMILQSERGIER